MKELTHIVSTLLSSFFFKPRKRYPKRWSPAFVAIQLGFFAGGVGLFGRDALLFLTVQDWDLIVGFELGFAAIIGVGFLMHTFGYAQAGVITSCLAGVGSATAFKLLGWGQC